MKLPASVLIRLQQYCNRTFHPTCRPKAYEAMKTWMEENGSYSLMTWRNIARQTKFYRVLPTAFGV